MMIICAVVWFIAGLLNWITAEDREYGCNSIAGIYFLISALCFIAGVTS